MTQVPESPPISTARLVARAEGAMLAAASGDALGWPIESRGNRVGGTRDLEPRLAFIDWKRREGSRYAPHEREVPAGTYSDDTQLMLAVGRSLALGDEWWAHLTQLELPMWTLYELGGGGAVKRAAQSWGRGVAPWAQPKPADREKYFAAGANGVVMRILPHAIYGAGDDDFGAVRERIVADGLATHGHPRALVGALAAGYGMWTALRWQGKVGYGALIEACLDGREEWFQWPDPAAYAPDWLERSAEATDSDYGSAWSHTVEEMLGLLDACREAIARGSLARDGQVLEELGAFDREGGAGTRTAAVALYLASRYVARPTAGLLAAAYMRKTDADTIACVTGALLGCLSGSDWVDGLARDLQDAPYIRELGDRLAMHEPANVAQTEWRPQLKRQLLDRLKKLDVGGDLPLPVFADGRVIEIERPETRSANEITIWWLATAIGQQIAITKVTKTPTKRAPDQQTESAPAGADAASEQLAIDEKAKVEEARGNGAQTLWTTLVVRDLQRTVALYSDVLGLSVRRKGDGFVVFRPNLVVEQDERPRRQSFRAARHPGPFSFETSPLLGVLVPPDAFQKAHHRLSKAGLYVSHLVRDPEGDRFRLEDPDGHVIEVRTTPAS